MEIGDYILIGGHVKKCAQNNYKEELTNIIEEERLEKLKLTSILERRLRDEQIETF